MFLVGGAFVVGPFFLRPLREISKKGGTLLLHELLNTTTTSSAIGVINQTGTSSRTTTNSTSGVIYTYIYIYIYTYIQLAPPASHGTPMGAVLTA